MKILNSVDNKKYDLDLKKVSIYNCGPTVYNYVHIGNVRPLITFDVLFRFLQFAKSDVLFMHNLTDIDDKIINQAELEKTSETAISTKYIDAYVSLFPILNILPMKMPKVSDHIQDIIDYVQKLVHKGFAYVSDGDVYFNVRKITNYGKISHRNIDDLLDGVRKENKENKNDPLDFALWKKTDRGLNWDSPWSKGRPGWHTECCVMINKYAGQEITIHGGGVDLKFPHHENENAQNNAMYGKDIAKIWMHVGHVNIAGQKMSKSLNNFILVKDIVNDQNANGLRWFFYQTKYQNPINYTKQAHESCLEEINNILKCINVAKTNLIAHQIEFIKNDHCLDKEFQQYIEDDLNFPNAIMIVTKQIKLLNNFIRQKDWNQAQQLIVYLENELTQILGIKYDCNIHQNHLDLIHQWHQAVEQQNYQKADQYRHQLIELKLL